MEKVNLMQKFAMFSEQWQPKIVGELNDSYVKIARIEGEFVWHSHANEDEMFYVVKGELIIRMRDRDIPVSEGEFVIIPRGVEHLPIAQKEVLIMLLEPKTTVNTGDVISEKTVSESEWL